ncbi:MAG: DUF1919 domain-containing protein [Rhodoferax sp.]|nr:DUF1919 domain-containing protein [Rhodoferax sp.]
MAIFNKILRSFALAREKYYLLHVKFIIISNNCWSYEIYKILGREYNTPFVGLYVYPDDYIRFLENFHKIIKLPLIFSSESKYIDAQQISYPIGLLAEDIEIHFLHYATEDEALVKWQRRVSRMQRDIEDGVAIYLKICDRDGLKDAHIERFMSLPFDNKISIGINKKPYKNHLVAENLRDMTGNFVVNGMDLFKKRYRYMDFPLWLKNGHIQKSVFSKILSKVLF